MAKLGLDYETLAEKFPRLIYVSHKGFLPGPYGAGWRSTRSSRTWPG